MKKEYAMYKGEECIAIGTLKEIADKLGIKHETAKWWTTPTARKRSESRKNKDRCLSMVCLEEDEE